MSEQHRPDPALPQNPQPSGNQGYPQQPAPAGQPMYGNAPAPAAELPRIEEPLSPFSSWVLLRLL